MKSNTSFESVISSFDAIVSRLRETRRVAVISHYNPDHDALGSSCALALGLRARGASVDIINDSGPDSRYVFIPGVSGIKSDFDPGLYETVIACDCGDAKRVGDKLSDKLKASAFVINIDHHLSNDHFGHLNLVVEHASSTAEIVFELLEALHVPLTPNIACALFAGIMGDTGSFRYASTSVRTFSIAARLVAAGAKPEPLSQAIYSCNSVAAVRLHSQALSQLRLHAGGKICELHVTQEMIEACQSKPGDTEQLVEKARDVEGVLVSFLARWEDGIWYVSLRSRGAAWDVSEVARSFGGGGHKSAAAFRWRKSFEELHPQLLQKLIQVVGE